MTENMAVLLGIRTVVIVVTVSGLASLTAALKPFPCYPDVCNRYEAHQFCDQDQNRCFECRKDQCGTELLPPKCFQFCEELAVKLAVKERDETLKNQECPPLEDIANGGHNGQTGLSGQGTTVESHCDAGYQLKGAQLAVCEEFGRWSNNLPVCVENQCVPPPTILNGIVSPTPQSSYHSGEVVRYQCDDGFSLDGIGRLWTCQDNGSWDQSVVPACLSDSHSGKYITIGIVVSAIAFIVGVAIGYLWKRFWSCTMTKPTVTSNNAEEQEPLQNIHVDDRSELSNMDPPAQLQDIDEVLKIDPKKVSSGTQGADPLPPRGQPDNPVPDSPRHPTDGDRPRPVGSRRGQSRSPAPNRGGAGRRAAGERCNIPAANSNPGMATGTQNSSRSSGLGSDESGEDERGNNTNPQMAGLAGVNFNFNFNNNNFIENSGSNNVNNQNSKYNNNGSTEEKPVTPNAQAGFCKVSTEETNHQSAPADQEDPGIQPGSVHQPVQDQPVTTMPNQFNTISPKVCPPDASIGPQKESVVCPQGASVPDVPEHAQPLMTNPADDDHPTKLAINSNTITHDDIGMASS